MSFSRATGLRFAGNRRIIRLQLNAGRIAAAIHARIDWFLPDPSAGRGLYASAHICHRQTDTLIVIERRLPYPEAASLRRDYHLRPDNILLGVNNHPGCSAFGTAH